MNDAPSTTHGTAPGGLEPHRGTLILVLGILSLVLCAFTAIPAWIMGKGDLAKIKDGIMDPEGEGKTKAGMICGMITCILVAVSLPLALLVWSWNSNMVQAPVQIGYYCLSCKKTDHISVYQANWRQYRGAMSDSVLHCVHCNKGRAHPTNECEKCGSVFILHLFPKYDEFGSPACPKCDAAYGQAAKAKEIDLMPKWLNP